MPLKIEQEEAPTINLTSMIDVLFLLIIFFMVGTKFNDSERQIELNLPRVNNATAMIAGPENHIVAIAHDGSTSLDGRSMNVNQISNELTKALRSYADTAVDIRCDNASTAQQFAEVLSLLKNIGINRIGFRTADAHNVIKR